jgi:hypothetical protein
VRKLSGVISMSEDKDLSSKSGYKNPPERYRFKKGESGNPNGRPKGARNIKGLFQDILEEEISLNQSGVTRYVTIQEAIARRVASDALKGKEKAIERMLAHAPQTVEEEARYTIEEWADIVLELATEEELHLFIQMVRRALSSKPSKKS